MPGTPQVWLEEFIVNLTTAGNQDDPDIIQLANGNILVAWTTDNDTGVGSPGEPDIIGQIFDPMGNRVGSEIRINNGSFFSDTENNVDLVALPNGGFVAVYQDVDVATSLRLIQFNAAGGVVSSSFDQQNIVDDLAAAGTSYRNPQIAVSNSTQAIVVYEETDGATTSIQMRTYNPTAQTFGAQTLIMFDTVAPAVATLSNGDIVIVGTRPTAGDNSVIMRILNPDGTSQLGFTTLTGTAGDGFNDNDVSVAALSGGGYVVVYTDRDATDTDTSFQIFNNAGGLVTGVTNVQGGTNNDNEAVVAGLSDGSFVIAYDDDTDNTIEVAHYSATGTFLGLQTISGSGQEMAIRDLGDGRFAVTWESTTGLGELRMEILDTRDFVNAEAVYNPEPNWQVGTIFSDIIVSDVDSDIVHGHLGNDVISDSTSSGGNQYFGDAGNDRLRVSTSIDSDVWDGGSGEDTIDFALSLQSDLIINLAAGTVTQGASTENIISFENAIGSNQNDSITGTAGINNLSGGGGDDFLDGGAGSDVMIGGAGNDNYFVDVITEQVIEAVGGGVDRIRASSTYVLAAGQEVEIISTTNDAGGASINLVGNEFAQTIIGNAGANVLNGNAGADTLRGFGGNDTYVVSANNDVIIEVAGQGTDQAVASASYVLQNGVSVESLATTNVNGLPAISLTGNGFNQTITGNAGVNVLNGLGGNDILRGNLGQDSFAFTSALIPANVDVIQDFTVVDDTIRLENGVFLGLANGVLAAGAFASNGTGLATQADDRIIYNSVTGDLFFDQDGVGGVAGIRFADLTAGLAMTNADFFVV